jgi:subtilase family serine protease
MRVLGRLAVAAGLVLAACSSLVSQGQVARSVPNRITSAINNADRVPLPHSMTGRPATSTDLGSLDGSTPLSLVSMILVPSATQQADLDQLLAAQQDPTSASYHQWLTPAQFGARFGASDSDIAKITTWLQSQGLQVLSVAPSRNIVNFSGTAAIIENAFGITMERYQRGGQTFFENSGELQIPSAMSGIVGGVTSLSSYRLKSQLVRATRPDVDATSSAIAKSQYTGVDKTGAVVHFLTPYDFRQIYGETSLVNSGYVGTGTSIAVLGQSAVNTTQIADFQALTGQTQKLPTITLVPGSGTSVAVSGDEGESEIDLEYTLGTATGATVNFVYTGNSSTTGVFGSMIYAVSNNLAHIITLSYGACEADVASYASSTFEPVLKQANAQGQTVMVSSGDTGAAACDGDDEPSTESSAVLGLSVNYPASSAYVTAVGGTTLQEGSGTYWNSSNNSFAGSENGTYIPEVVWNDSIAAKVLEGSGGGASQIFGKPSWQTGLGVPADGKRDLPDVSFAASPNHDGFLFCSAEATSEACTTTSFGTTVIGGTSLDAPNFAAMIALIEQATGNTSGLGNVNPQLYTLAAGSSSTSIFHDITTGTNKVPCVSGSPDCVGGTTQIGYTATTAYDQATGLGSINASALLTALTPATIVALPAPTMVLTASNITPTVNTSVSFYATLTSTSTGATPTGTVAFSIDGAASNTATISAGVATYTLTAGFTTAGTHTITAVYSGGAPYGPTSSSLTVNVTTAGAFTLSSSPATLTVVNGNSATEQITVTPNSGFNSNVSFTAAINATSFNGCYVLNPVSLSQGTAVTTVFTLYTAASDCASAGKAAARVMTVSASNQPPQQPRSPFRTPAIVLAGGLLGLCMLRRRSRWNALLLALISVALLASGGCGGGSIKANSGTTTTSSQSGTYTLTVTGTSSTNTTQTASTSFSLVVQ